MTNKDLRSRLAGLFSGGESEPEPEEESLLEGVIGILDVHAAAEPEEPSVKGAPLLVPVEPEEEGGRSKAPSLGDLAWQSELGEQRTRILNVMLGSLAGIGAVVIVFLAINLVRDPARFLKVYIPYFAAYALLVLMAVSRRLHVTVRAYFVALLAYVVGIFAMLNEGTLTGGGGFYLLAAPLLLGLLVGHRTGIVASALSSLCFVGFLLAEHLGWFHPSAPFDAAVLASVLSIGATFVLVSACLMFVQRMFNHALTGALRDLAHKHEQVALSQSLLEARADDLAAANASLQKLTLQLQNAAQVSHVASSVLDLAKLVQRVVDVIRERFDLYYVGLFLLEESGQGAELRGGTGRPGRQMVAQGYRVELGGTLPVARCITEGQACIALDVGEGAVRFEYSLLPETRSEIALPLRSRGQVVGALDLHSAEGEAFSQDDVAVLQTLADHLAAAIDNARLFAETRASLEEVEARRRRQVREHWAAYAQVAPIYERVRPDVPPLGDVVPEEVERVMTHGEVVVSSGGGDGAAQATLAAPITLRGEVIGALGLHEVGNGRQWTDDEVALIQAVADQMALAIENARLLDEARRRAEQERLAAEITARVRASTEVEVILRTAVRELGQALRASDGLIRLGAEGEGEAVGDRDDGAQS